MSYHEKCPKVAGIYTDTLSICEALKQATQDCDHNSVSIIITKSTLVTANQNVDMLDASFMCTQILKEILLTIDFDQGHFQHFLIYCHEKFVNYTIELRLVDQIEKEYHLHLPI